MPIIAKAGAKSSFAPAPVGLHQGICIDVVDLGVLEVTYQGDTKRQHKVRLVWELDATMEDGRPFLVGKRYTLSLHEKASLRKDLESWRGRAFTDEELEGFDLEKLIGANGQVNVQHTVRDGTTYANVVSLVPLGRGMQRMSASPSYIRVQDRTETAPRDDQQDPLTAEDIPF